jgi:tetratricopeptide (TPR) repeat protein
MPRSLAALVPFAFILAVTCSAEKPSAEGPEAEAAGGGVPAEALELHNRGFAALENEQPADAEEAYAKLAERLPGDPLPWANLAVARLRQQETDAALEAVAKGLEAAEEGGETAGRLHALRGAILDWAGRPEEALEAYRKGAELAPEDPETLYSLYRQGVALGETEAAAAALDRLVEVRPDNFVVLVERGKQAIQEGDRETASGVYLRIRELLWQAPPVAETAMDGVLEALESGGASGDATTARVPAARLENVLKVTPMYRESLRELSPGIQGVPLRSFEAEPAPAGAADWGEPVAVRFQGERLAETPTPAAASGAALALGDFDGDGQADVARLVERPSGEGGVAVEIRPAAGGEPRVLAAPGATGLLAADLRNDGAPDLLAFGPGVVAIWEGTPAGSTEGGATLAPAEPAALGLAGAGARAAAVIDYDIEADLDLVLAGGGGGAALELYRNSLESQAPLEPVAGKVFAGLELPAGVRAVVASDLDRDGDPDLVLAGAFGLRWLDNLRQGVFADRTEAAGLSGAPAASALVAADLDNDGLPELVAAGPDGLTLWRNHTGEGGGFERWNPEGLPSGAFTAVVAADLDNDGRLDLAAAGPKGVVAVGQDGQGGFRDLPIEGGPSSATAVLAADLDGDGDLDLLAAGPEGLHRLTNQGGNANHWLRVRLVGLTQGSGKNNVQGVGATVEVMAGLAYQFREHDGGVSHFGLGRLEEADVLRVMWNNGVPQNRIDVAGDQTLVEEQVLKGSCPFVYAWNGERQAFVTDLLWGAPAGLPVAEGVWAPADAEELVEVVGARVLPAGSDSPGRYDLRVTEELWEAAYFDYLRLWVVDYPAEVEVASSLKVVPGEVVPDRVLGSRDVRPVAAAWDGRGREVTERVRARDHVYADGYEESLYQGLAREPWTFTFDLGDHLELAAGGPVRLLLDGWIFPTDASINVALSQRPDLGLEAPRLEVETAAGWRTLIPSMGHPAGKTKTMIVDTPPLPPLAGSGLTSRRLRIVTNQWLHWDRIAWSPLPAGAADGAARVVARLAPERADLRFRGFSALVRRAPNAPHEFDYARVSTDSPWGVTRGPYTRFGDVRELLQADDSRSVVLGPGDEIALLFDASHLPPPPEGHRRTVFLESHGWDKDFDKHTYAVESGSLPLPFHGMKVYPWGDDEQPPDPKAMDEFRREWLTREHPGPERE